MTRVSADKWSATIYATADYSVSYKYDLGGTWSNVEQTADCGLVSNRSLTVNGGTMNDTVANWAGPGPCGDSTAVINATVPSNTPSSDAVYLSGTYHQLGTAIPASDDWVPTDYPMVQTGPDTWTLTITGVPTNTFRYKFTLGSWDSVEETSACGYVQDRTFGFDTADASYAATATVTAWKGTAGC